jgi:hypothetical protein
MFFKFDTKSELEKKKDYVNALANKDDWPTGRAVFISNSNQVIIEVNNIDHLTISFKMEL